MNIRTPRRAFALAILAAACLPAAAAETVSRAEDREGVAVTIYNDSLALIKELRRIPFERGANSGQVVKRSTVPLTQLMRRHQAAVA